MEKTDGTVSPVASGVPRSSGDPGSPGDHPSFLTRLFKRHWLKRHGPLLAFVLIAVVGALALHGEQASTAQKLYNNSYQACLRNNYVRDNQRNIVANIHLSDSVVQQFMADAALARSQSYGANRIKSDAQAAKEYQQLENQLVKDASKLHTYPPVNCRIVIKKP